MRDVQSEYDKRDVHIDRVGVSGLSWPIRVLDRENNMQDTVACVSMSVFLPKDYRGTHMSRFVEVLSAQENDITFHNMEGLLVSLSKRLHSEEAHAEFAFPYFITKYAPVTHAKGRMRYDVKFSATLKGCDFDLVTELIAPIQTLCPCSKEISEFGAHNQRAHASIAVRLNSFMWIEELAEIADECASAPVYSLLKREDEKQVTERAYQNPRFVEDSVRDLALALENEPRITWYKVSVSSHESIHNHDAFAGLERYKNQ